MSSSRVIKLAVADKEGVAVLIHVTVKKKDDLDLDLQATDGESAFEGKGGANQEGIGTMTSRLHFVGGSLHTMEPTRNGKHSSNISSSPRRMKD